MLKRQTFEIAAIRVPVKRAKTVDPARVEAIAESMLEAGQTTPILVRPDGAGFVLVEGLHRLEAKNALGDTTIELISYEGASVEPAPRHEHLGYRLMALEVDDMQKTLEYLKTKAIEPVWGPRIREDCARAEIEDPGGHRIELRQWFR